MIWDSGKVESDVSIHQVYDGPDLESSMRYDWRVRIWDRAGSPTAWSESSFWEMGLLEEDDWKAEWIEAELNEDVSRSGPCPMLREVITIDGSIRSARL